MVPEHLGHGRANLNLVKRSMSILSFFKKGFFACFLIKANIPREIGVGILQPFGFATIGHSSSSSGSLCGEFVSRVATSLPFTLSGANSDKGSVEGTLFLGSSVSASFPLAQKLVEFVIFSPEFHNSNFSAPMEQGPALCTKCMTLTNVDLN